MKEMRIMSQMKIKVGHDYLLKLTNKVLSNLLFLMTYY